MIEKMIEFSKTLDARAISIMDKIAETDPFGEEYRTLLENYSATMAISSTVNRTLASIVAKAKEEKKDESNN